MNILHVNKYPSTTCFLSEFHIIPSQQIVLGVLGQEKNLDIAMVCDSLCLSQYILFFVFKEGSASCVVKLQRVISYFSLKN